MLGAPLSKNMEKRQATASPQQKWLRYEAAMCALEAADACGVDNVSTTAWIETQMFDDIPEAEDRDIADLRSVFEQALHVHKQMRPQRCHFPLLAGWVVGWVEQWMIHLALHGREATLLWTSTELRAEYGDSLDVPALSQEARAAGDWSLTAWLEELGPYAIR